MAGTNKQKPKSESNTPRRLANSAVPQKPLAQRIREAQPGSPLVLRIRLTALCALILVLALVFAVPRRPEAPRTLDRPNEAFVDRAGLVSKDYASTTAGALLREVRYQMVIYTDTGLPEGSLAEWTNEKATEWQVGSQEDNGIALFVFRDARIARVEVGYDLENRLTDLLVRRLLEHRLAPHFAGGDFEGGFDAFIEGVGNALGGDDALHKLWMELGGKPRKGTVAMLFDTYSEGIDRAPRMIQATWRTYIEGGTADRIFVLFCVAIFLAILSATVTVAIVTIAIAVKLSKGQPDAVDAIVHSHEVGVGFSHRARLATGAFVIVFGIFTVLLFSQILMFALSLIGEQMHRKGDFGGAGAQVMWQAAR